MPGSGGKQILPPHHLADLHPGIVGNDRELIGKNPVGTPEDKIAAVPGEVFLLRAEQAVTKGDGFVGYA